MTHPPDIMEKARELAKCLTAPDFCMRKNYFDEAICIIAAALAEARAVPQWLPIETMPSTPCMVTDGNIVTIYSGGFMPWNEGRSIVFPKNPTHWQPLPPASNPPIAGGKP